MAGTLAKVVLIIINSIFLICGLGILALGVLVRISFDKFKDAFESISADTDLVKTVDTLSIGVICFGCFIFLIALLGCVGACCRIRCFLALYAVIVIIIIIAQIGVIALYGIKRSDAEDLLKKNLMKGLQGYHEATGRTDKDKSFDSIFNTLDCCGVNNYTDFQNKVSGMKWDQRNDKKKIPVTCCKGVDYNNIKDLDFQKVCISDPKTSNAYIEGCYPTLVDWLDKHKPVVIGVGVGIFLIEILVLILAFFLCCMDHEKDLAV